MTNFFHHMGKVRGEGEKTKKPSRGKREREGKYLLLERGLIG
jgi:hypothetical protein